MTVPASASLSFGRLRFPRIDGGRNRAAVLRAFAAAVGATTILLCAAGEGRSQGDGDAPKLRPAPSVNADRRAAGDAKIVDQFGDSLPEGAVARAGSCRFRPGSMTYMLMLSADGKTIASNSYDGPLSLFDTSTGEKLRTMVFNRGRPLATGMNL